ncbi:MAG: hypothetical protein C6W55_00705 [Thermobacillus sp.]|uniref:hypothetical protein n=1 Tax=Thermobacillus TaxID=76632 RepID=UPI0005A48777|nr:MULTISPECIES: hypothetical protein [Thermobacillus]REK59797.1 MAG: hypothetical protein C6W55_00705 [Thermobacillus sp.]
MASQKAKFEQYRIRMLSGFLIGFTFWQIPMLLSYIWPNNETVELVGAILSPIALIGGIVWAYYLFQVVRFVMILRKNPDLNKTLNDERIQHTRLKSFAVGFWVVVMLQAPLFYLAPLVGMTVQGVILTNIFFGVTSALLAFLIFERAQ